MSGRRAKSTQEQNPRSAVVRTVVVALVVLLPVMNATLGIIAEELEPYGEAVPGWVFGILNVGIAVTAIFIAVFTRVMAIPGVNEFFRTHFKPLAPEDSPSDNTL